MKVPYSEDLDSHTGPEPHGGCGNTMADAWVGGSVGGALSSEITSFGCRPCCLMGMAISTAALYASCGRTWRSLSTLACVDTSCAGIGRPGKNPSFRAGIGECETSAGKSSCGIGGGSAPMEVMSRKNRVQMEIVAWAGEGVMPYVQFIKLLGSRTQRSTEEAGEQEDMSTSAEPVEGRT
jgi:hypothetical protein